MENQLQARLLALEEDKKRQDTLRLKLQNEVLSLNKEKTHLQMQLQLQSTLKSRNPSNQKQNQNHHRLLQDLESLRHKKPRLEISEDTDGKLKTLRFECEINAIQKQDHLEMILAIYKQILKLHLLLASHLAKSNSNSNPNSSTYAKQHDFYMEMERIKLFFADQGPDFHHVADLILSKVEAAYCLVQTSLPPVLQQNVFYLSFIDKILPQMSKKNAMLIYQKHWLQTHLTKYCHLEGDLTNLLYVLDSKHITNFSPLRKFRVLGKAVLAFNRFLHNLLLIKERTSTSIEKNTLPKTLERFLMKDSSPPVPHSECEFVQFDFINPPIPCSDQIGKVRQYIFLLTQKMLQLEAERKHLLEENKQLNQVSASYQEYIAKMERENVDLKQTVRKCNDLLLEQTLLNEQLQSQITSKK